MPRRVWPLALAVAALTFVAFLPALEGGFVNWDDNTNFLGNLHFRGLGWQELRWMFTSALLGHYIPLTWLSLGLNHVLGGMDPRGYHLGNLLLHAANAGLFCVVAGRLLSAALLPLSPHPLSPHAPPDGERDGDGRGQGEGGSAAALAVGAAVAGLAWGLHPLRVESVAWVTERRDVLCGVFYLLAVQAYLRGAAGGGMVRGRWLAVSLAAFGAALLSKAMAMTLPVSLLILDAYPLGRWRAQGWRVAMKEKLAYAVLSGAGAVVAVMAVGRGAAWTGYEAYGVEARVAMVGYSLWFYPWKLVWPDRLSPLYELPVRVDLSQWRFLGPLIAVLVVTAVLTALRRRWPVGLAVWAHSAVVLAPVSGVVHAGHQLAHDRYSYLSGLGFAALAGAGVTMTLLAARRGRVRRWVVVLVVATAALGLTGWGAASWRQSQVWRDSETLWRAAVVADPSCAHCHNNLGAAIVRSGPAAPARPGEAALHFVRAIELRPDRPDPYYNLASLLAAEKRYDDAERVLRTYMARFAHLADGPRRLGMLYREQGRNAEAIPLLRQALAMQPEAPGARVDLGQALNNRGADLVRSSRLEEAASLFLEAARLLPADSEPLRNLGQTLVMRGKGREAVEPLERARALDPRNGPARFWLARAYALIGERDRADAEIAALREIDPALAGQVTTGR